MMAVPLSVRVRVRNLGDHPMPSKEPRSPGRPVQPLCCPGSRPGRGGRSTVLDPVTGTLAAIRASAWSAVKAGSSAPPVDDGGQLAVRGVDQHGHAGGGQLQDRALAIGWHGTPHALVRSSPWWASVRWRCWLAVPPGQAAAFRVPADRHGVRHDAVEGTVAVGVMAGHHQPLAGPVLDEAPAVERRRGDDRPLMRRRRVRWLGPFPGSRSRRRRILLPSWQRACPLRRRTGGRFGRP